VHARYNATAFPKLGKCTLYGDIARQYSQEILPSADTPGKTYYNFIDVSDDSCLNGWAMGNIAASGLNLAMFFRDLYAPPPGQELLSAALAEQMTDPKNLAPLSNNWACGLTGVPDYNCDKPPPQCATLLSPLHGGSDCCECSKPPANASLSGWVGCTSGCLSTFTDGTFAKPKNVECYGVIQCPGVCSAAVDHERCTSKYGLGMFLMDQYEKIAVPGTGNPDDAMYWGHGGVDYGSGSAGICGFNYRYKFGVCINYNSYTGMNCSIGDESVSAAWLKADAGMLSPIYSSCVLYSVVLSAHGGPRLDCLSMLGGFNPGYDCHHPPSECVRALQPFNDGRDCCGCIATKGQAGPSCSAACATVGVEHPECQAQITQCGICPGEQLGEDSPQRPVPTMNASSSASVAATTADTSAYALSRLVSHELLPRRWPADGFGVATRGPGAACSAALTLACGSLAKGPACNVCTGQHQEPLRHAGCAAADLVLFCSVPKVGAECGWYNTSRDPGRMCRLCKSTVWWPCKPCQLSPAAPQCAPCALPLSICPKIPGCW
jgi:hypothetical protein